MTADAEPDVSGKAGPQAQDTGSSRCRRPVPAHAPPGLDVLPEAKELFGGFHERRAGDEGHDHPGLREEEGLALLVEGQVRDAGCSLCSGGAICRETGKTRIALRGKATGPHAVPVRASRRRTGLPRKDSPAGRKGRQAATAGADGTAGYPCVYRSTSETA